MRFNILLAVVLTPLLAGHLYAAEPQTGPVIQGFGAVYDVPAGAWNLEPDLFYKVSMDVSDTADFSGERNRHLESAARFLNMQARNGIEPGHIEMAIVVHGGASRDLLTDDAYRARYNEPNPNTAMLAELRAAGVKVYLCGQTAAHRKIGLEELNPAVSLALSAMTAHVRLQSEGYTLIPF